MHTHDTHETYLHTGAHVPEYPHKFVFFVPYDIWYAYPVSQYTVA